MAITLSSLQAMQITEVTWPVSPSSRSWPPGWVWWQGHPGPLTWRLPGPYCGLSNWEFVFSADPRGHNRFSVTKCRVLLGGDRQEGKWPIR